MHALPGFRVLAWPAGSEADSNPYTRLMYSAFKPPRATIIPFQPLMAHVPIADVFHIQWPEGIFEGRLGRHPLGARMKALRILRTVARIRRTGGVLALTIHNLAPHATLTRSRQTLYDRYLEKLLIQADLLIGLSTASLVQFSKHHANVRGVASTVIPHPHYRTCYPAPISQEKARAQLNLPGGTIIATIGAVRPSKQIPAAIMAFRAAARDDETLLIAGACDDNHLWREILDARAQDMRIVLRRGHLTDEDLVTAISATDICLINQATTLNSGTALLALSLHRRLVAPNVGTLPELQNLVGDDWVALTTVPLEPKTLRQALDRLRRTTTSECTPLETLAPRSQSEKLLTSFEHILAQTRCRKALRV